MAEEDAAHAAYTAKARDLCIAAESEHPRKYGTAAQDASEGGG
jgi:hypothetical protein